MATIESAGSPGARPHGRHRTSRRPGARLKVRVVAIVWAILWSLVAPAQGSARERAASRARAGGAAQVEQVAQAVQTTGASGGPAAAKATASEATFEANDQLGQQSIPRGTEPAPEFAATAMEGSASAADALIERPYLQRAPLKLSINNGLDGLREEVLPYVAELAGAGFQRFSSIIFFGPTRMVCVDVEAGLQALELLAIVTSDSFEGSFGAGGRLEAEVEIDGHFSGELFVRADEVENTGCDLAEVGAAIIDFLDLGDLGTFELPLIDALGDLFGFGGAEEEEVWYDEEDFELDDLSVTFDGTFAAVGSQVQLAEVDEVDADLGSISFDGDGFLDSLTDLLNTILTGGCLFAFGTSDLDDCAQAGADLLADAEVIPSLESLVEDTLNEAMAISIQFEEDVTIASSQLAFGVSLADIESSRADNEMTGIFDATVEALGPEDDCAARLSYSGGLYANDPAPTGSDIDIHLPLGFVAETLYELGRQGEFCFETSLSDASGALYDVDVRPAGTLRVENGEERVCGEIDGGFPVCWVEHPGEMRITLPVEVDGTVSGLSGSASGTVEIYASLDVRARNVFLEIMEINVLDVTGNLTLPAGGTIDVSRQVSALANATTARLAAGLPAQPLLPRATDLPEEFRLTIDRVRVDSTYITAGVNISRVEMMHAEIDRGEETVNHRPPEEPEDLDPGILDRLDPLP